MGRPAKEFIADTDKTLEILGEITRRRRWRGEIAAKRRDNSTFYVELAASVVNNERSGKKEVAFSLVSLSERERIAQELKEKDRLFRAIVNNAAEGIVTSDEHGAITFWNEAAQKIFGYKPEEVIGKPLTVLIPKHVQKSKRDGIGKVSAAVLPPERVVESVGLRKDGTEFPIELSFASWQSKKGRAMMIVLRDITEGKKAKEKIRLLSNVVEQITDGIAVVGMDRRIIFANSAWLRMHGYRDGEGASMVGKNAEVFYQDVWECTPDQVFETNGMRRRATHIRKDGTMFPVLTSVSPLRDEDGKSAGIIMMSRSLTEIVRDIRDTQSRTPSASGRRT